jgi:pimeloyl-ACP methyl ester carboxylesterase
VILDTGTGDPIVIIPGIQGRWEYLRAAVDALARAHRVVTFSLADGDLDDLVEQVARVLDARGLQRAAICGISFGGHVALRFAARLPDRTSALILVSPPGPGWHLKRTHRLYARLPLLFAPLFFAGMPRRLRGEIAAAIPDRATRRDFTKRQAVNALRAPVSPSKIAKRARLIDGLDAAADCARITAPTLIITGEAALDHVVPAGGGSEYLNLIRGSHAATLERTGHLGCITRPEAFAELVGRFVEGARRHAA